MPARRPAASGESGRKRRITMIEVDEVYAEVDIPLDATHVVRYTLCDDEVIGTRIVTT